MFPLRAISYFVLVISFGLIAPSAVTLFSGSGQFHTQYTSITDPAVAIRTAIIRLVIGIAMFALGVWLWRQDDE
ncbi:MAG: hypothetical protein KDC26_12770 [Armatimonadetes bacterium]|nr:hypothetical protein [Armatimonadota bacterium]